MHFIILLDIDNDSVTLFILADQQKKKKKKKKKQAGFGWRTAGCQYRL